MAQGPDAQQSLLRSLDLAALRALEKLPRFEEGELAAAYDDACERTDDGESLAESVRSMLSAFWFLAALLILTPCAALSAGGMLSPWLAVLPAVLGGVSAAASMVHGVVEGFYRRRRDGSRGFVAAESNALFVGSTAVSTAIFLGIFAS